MPRLPPPPPSQFPKVPGPRPPAPSAAGWGTSSRPPPQPLLTVSEHFTPRSLGGPPPLVDPSLEQRGRPWVLSCLRPYLPSHGGRRAWGAPWRLQLGPGRPGSLEGRVSDTLSSAGTPWLPCPGVQGWSPGRDGGEERRAWNCTAQGGSATQRERVGRHGDRYLGPAVGPAGQPNALTVPQRRNKNTNAEPREPAREPWPLRSARNRTPRKAAATGEWHSWLESLVLNK